MEDKIIKHLHEELSDIYKVFAEVCDKNNLQYFVVGGTLLGAVVHKGYIPWDDDLDVAMPRDDYDMFISEISKQLPEGYYLHHTVTDPDYWLSFAKVRKRGTEFQEEKRKNIKVHNEIYIDIFPFDYAGKKNTFFHKFRWRLITYLNNYIYSKQTQKKPESSMAKVLGMIFNLFSIKRLSLFRDKLMRNFDNGERKYYVDLAGGRRLDNSYFNIEDIIPIHNLPFEEMSVKVPNDPNSYLLQLYTERYKIIPPPEQRVTHEPQYIRFSDGEFVKFREE